MQNTIRIITLSLFLFFLLLESTQASALLISGVYGSLLLGLDPQTQILTGYYLNGTGLDSKHGGPQFRCSFYLRGTKTSEGFNINTWFPGDPTTTQVSGKILLPGAASAASTSVIVKLNQMPGGCGMVDPELAQSDGETFTQDALGHWSEIRVVSAPRLQAHAGLTSLAAMRYAS